MAIIGMGPKMIEIREFEDVTQIKMKSEVDSRANHWVSAYLVDGLLIDTGCIQTAKELVKYLSTKHLTACLNTHHHEDHIGANRLLQETFHIDILAHPGAIPFISRAPELPNYRQKTCGIPPSSLVNPVPDTIKTGRYCFHVVDTPGHCLWHVALVELHRGWCFSGDLFVGKKLRVASSENNITQMARSMRKLLDFRLDRLVLFTSLRTIEINGRSALEKCIDRFQQLSERAKSLHEKGLDVEEIVREFWGSESVFARITHGHYSSATLVRLLIEADL